MKKLLVCLLAVFIGLLVGCSASAVHQAVTASAATVTLDLGTAVALLSLIIGVLTVGGAFFKVSAVFESLRTRLTVIESELKHVRELLDARAPCPSE